MIGPDTRTLIIFKEEMNNIMKIFNNLEKSALSIKNVSETIQNEIK